MLDVIDFIVEKGGDPKKIKESQRRRYAPEEAVDEVIALYEDHRKSEYELERLDSRTDRSLQHNTKQHSSMRRSMRPRSRLE